MAAALSNYAFAQGAPFPLSPALRGEGGVRGSSPTPPPRLIDHQPSMNPSRSSRHRHSEASASRRTRKPIPPAPPTSPKRKDASARFRSRGMAAALIAYAFAQGALFPLSPALRGEGGVRGSSPTPPPCLVCHQPSMNAPPSSRHRHSEASASRRTRKPIPPAPPTSPKRKRGTHPRDSAQGGMAAALSGYAFAQPTPISPSRAPPPPQCTRHHFPFLAPIGGPGM